MNWYILVDVPTFLFAIIADCSSSFTKEWTSRLVYLLHRNNSPMINQKTYNKCNA